MFHEAFKFKNAGICSDEYENQAKQISGKLTQTRIYSVIKTLSVLLDKFKQNANYNLLLTHTAVALKKAINS